MNIRFLLAMAAGALAAGPVLGGQVTYTIDPTRSFLRASDPFVVRLDAVGDAVGPGELAPAGFVTAYAGSIVADRDPVADTLRVTGGSVAAQNSGFYEPSYSPANYGLTDPGLPNQICAVRDFAFSLSSSIIPSAVSFDASRLSAVVSSGRLDYFVLTDAAAGAGVSPMLFTVIDGSSPLAGSLVFAPGGASLVVGTGGIETLTIAVDADLPLDFAGTPLVTHLSGTIVATGTVPEPTSVVSLVTFALLLRRRRRVG